MSELRNRVAELESRLALAERTSEALREVGLALGSTLDLDQLLELILTKITDIVGADRATLYLLDERRGKLLSRIIIGDEAKAIELPVGQGIAGYVAQVGKTLNVRDAYRDSRFARTWDEMTGYRTRSILAAPMKNHVGRIIGVIQVLNKQGTDGPVEFSSADEELLTALATQAAVSIDNSRLFLSVIQKNMQLVETKEQLEHRVSDLKLLFELESAMGRASSMEELARAVVVEAARACEAQAGGLLVDEEETGVALYFVDLEAARKSGSLAHAPVKRMSVKRGDGVAGAAMLRAEAVSIPATPGTPSSDDGPVSTRLGQAFGLVVRSAIAVPLEGPDEMTLGALALYNARSVGGFTQDARALLRLVSANASTALRLFRSRVDQERSERLTAIGRLLSGVMHDLRTPLTVISGYVQLMAMAEDSGQREEYAQYILRQFDAISAMQREVLEFARGERSVLLRKVYLSRFFAEVKSQLEQELVGTKVELALEIEDKGVARFDEGKITRAIHNLARNAIEAMGQTGQLTVRAYIKDKDFWIEIEDTGHGIPDGIRERVFQSFVTSGKKQGTGLGLAIVKKIVEEHAGEVVVNTGPSGTNFSIRLPKDGPSRHPRPSQLPPPAVAAPPSQPKAKASTPSAKKKVASKTSKKANGTKVAKNGTKAAGTSTKASTRGSAGGTKKPKVSAKGSSSRRKAASTAKAGQSRATSDAAAKGAARRRTRTTRTRKINEHP